jgi:apolipoprotein N-acyltransferase
MKALRTNTYLQQSHLLLDLLALISGTLLPLAFAPINLVFLAFVCPFFLLFSLSDCSNKRALWRGWLFGFANFAVGASWIFVSIHTFGNTSIWLAGIITLGFVAGLGLFYALMSLCYVAFFPKKHWISVVLVFPCCWVLQEVFRSWVLTGFPWLLLGNTQLHTYLGSYAPLFSVYGVSFLVILCVGLLYKTLQTQRARLANIIIFIVLLAVGFGLHHYQWSSPVGAPIKVSLIQGNISQTLKWNPAYLHYSLQRYQQLSFENTNSQLIVWPEGAVPDLLSNQRDYLSTIDDRLKRDHSALITGIALSNHPERTFYNGVITLGDAYGIYMKRHLVPFGEYVPFENLLRGLIGFFNLPMSNFSAGPYNQTLLKVDGINIATYLCYEIAYLNLVLHDAPQAQLLLNLSDDSWFGDSWAAAQQLQIAQMRSLETAREQIVVANSGFTALIGVKGNIKTIAPRDQIFVLNTIAQGYQGNTPLVQIGWLIELIALILLTIVCYFIARRQFTALILY